MRSFRPAVALFVLAILLSVTASLPVLAQSGEATSITHRQSVRTEMSPSGDIEASRIFTQLTVQGEGDVEVVLPAQSTRGLRNLDGFGRPSVDRDQVTFNVSATPEGASERTVATHRDPLPIELDVSYRLDGSPIEPQALVGRSGELEVSFTVRNTTAEPTEITYQDGVGATYTETIDVAVPFVGSVSMELDNRFVAIDAPGASVAGNGRGDTVVSWSMVLFEPVGSEEQTVTYTARVTDAVVPGVIAQFLPVDSNSFGSLASVQDSFGAVADGLREIAGGGLQIDANLQALAIGAQQLFLGVGRLANGGEKLADGLNDSAVPGSRQLADGTGAASDGSRRLAVGAGTAQEGSRELAAGMGAARAGGQELSSGLGQLSAGAGELSAGLGQASAGSTELSTGLGQLAAGSQELSAGGSDLAAGAGAIDANMVLIAEGAADLEAGAALVVAGLEQLKAAANATTGTPALIAGVDELSRGVAGLIAGIGDASGPDKTLLNVLALLKLGVDNPELIDDQPGLKQGLAGLTAALFTGTDTETPLGVTSVRTLISNVRGLIAAEIGDDAGSDPRVQQLDVALVILGSAKSDEGTVRQGLAGLDNGADQLLLGLMGLEGGISNPRAFLENRTCEPTDVPANRCGLLQGLQLLAGGLNNPPAAAVGAPTHNPRCLSEGHPDYVDGMAPCGLRQGLELSLATLNAGLGSVEDDPKVDPTLLGGANAVAQGAAALAGGTGQLRAEGTAPLAAGAGALAGGAGQVAAGASAAAAGAGDLNAGLGQLDAGGQQLAAGASAAAAGSGDLAAGLGQLDDGANRLASGLRELGDGARQLADGLGQLDDGANQLADGLGDAGDGAQAIADGLVTVEDGMSGVAEGSRRLTDEGTSQLVAGASEATITPAIAVEHAMAADARGQAGEGLPYGTVDGAEASAVYQFELAAIGSPDGGPSTPMRGIMTVLAMAAAGGLALVLRQRIA